MSTWFGDTPLMAIALHIISIIIVLGYVIAVLLGLAITEQLSNAFLMVLSFYLGGLTTNALYRKTPNGD